MFRSFRARRLSQKALERFERDSWEGAASVLEHGKALAAEAWAHFAVALYNRGSHEPSERAVRRALEIDPARGDALIFLAELLAELKRSDEAIDIYRRLLARFPRAALQALALAKLLVEKAAFGDAKQVLLPFAAYPLHDLRQTMAGILFHLGEHAAVVALLGPTIKEMKLELQTTSFYGKARNEAFASYQDVIHMHDEAVAALHGRERVIESAAARGDLNARAGINYKLLGEARLVEAPRWSVDARLRSVADGQAFGEALIAAGERSRGLCHLGLCHLRRNQLPEARRLFDRARDEDDGNFAAYLGLGAAMDLEATRAFERISRLTDLGQPPEWMDRVVVDWPALTMPERRVVLAAVWPLATLLQPIMAAGAVVRILPIDARLTDLPEMAAGANERFEDRRCLAAITGAATARICASKIEGLLDVMGEQHSVFAHELAHLAHFHAPEAVQLKIDELYEIAVQEEHVITAYQTTNAQAARPCM